MIIEPFAGSAGYATRYPDREVVLVERGLCTISPLVRESRADDANNRASMR
jgi:hypothetical protein